MPELPLKYFCYVCGQQNDLTLNIPVAPKMSREEITIVKRHSSIFSQILIFHMN